MKSLGYNNQSDTWLLCYSVIPSFLVTGNTKNLPLFISFIPPSLCLPPSLYLFVWVAQLRSLHHFYFSLVCCAFSPHCFNNTPFLSFLLLLFAIFLWPYISSTLPLLDFNIFFHLSPLLLRLFMSPWIMLILIWVSCVLLGIHNLLRYLDLFLSFLSCVLSPLNNAGILLFQPGLYFFVISYVLVLQNRFKMYLHQHHHHFFICDFFLL